MITLAALLQRLKPISSAFRVRPRVWSQQVDRWLQLARNPLRARNLIAW